MTLHSIDAGFMIELLKHEPLWLVLLYVGPDQILPLTTFLGAFIGIILMFWRYVVGLVGRVWQLLFRR